MNDIADAADVSRPALYAFEIWAIGPFEMTMASLAAEELVDCNFAFAQTLPQNGSAKSF